MPHIHTAWLIQQKLIQSMVERDAFYTLCGAVQVDDSYLGSELAGGKAGWYSENKVPSYHRGVVVSLKICRNLAESTRYWATSK
jgi:hypothetical protein